MSGRVRKTHCQPADRFSGPGATLIMAAFTQLNPEGSRFSDGSCGVYCAANTLETSIAEVSDHRAQFLARTAEPEIDVDLRWTQAELRQQVHDVRRRSEGPTAPISPGQLGAIYHPDHCAAGQALGRDLRGLSSSALVYDSVRSPKGQCVAVFVPRALANARPAGHFGLHWDGQRISHWFEKGEPRPLAQNTATVMPATFARRAGRTAISTRWSSQTRACIGRRSEMFCSL